MVLSKAATFLIAEIKNRFALKLQKASNFIISYFYFAKKIWPSLFILIWSYKTTIISLFSTSTKNDHLDHSLFYTSKNNLIEL